MVLAVTTVLAVKAAVDRRSVAMLVVWLCWWDGYKLVIVPQTHCYDIYGRFTLVQHIITCQ